MVGYFPNALKRTCEACDPQCILCIDNATDCI